MNLTQPLSPLPQALRRPPPAVAHRRRRVGQYEIETEALRYFNDLLERLDLTHPPLEPDQVASAARDLTAHSRPVGWPECILQRMRRAGAIDRMLHDREWEVGASAPIAALVVEYLRGNRPLIPNTLPVVGRLDDVILVEASWPAVAKEVQDYFDFCRLRRVEAALRGESRPYFGFSRQAWQAASRAEAEWVAHRHRVSGSRYVSDYMEPHFRVQ